MQINELIVCENGMEGIVLNLEEDNIELFSWPYRRINEGDIVKRTGRMHQ